MSISVELIQLLSVLTIACIAAAAIYAVHMNEKTIAGKPISNTDDIITITLQSRQRKIKLAGVKMSLKQYYGIMTCAIIILFLFCYFATNKMLIAICVSLAGFLIPNIVIGIMQNRSEKRFSENYQKALEIMTVSLKAGNTFNNAVKDVLANRFIPSDVKQHFQKLDAELEMGTTIGDAFRNFAEETGNPYVIETSVAIDVQNTIGGREDTIIKNISTSILDEIVLNKKVATAFASTTALVRLMDFLPAGVILFMTVTGKSYVAVFFQSTPMICLYAAILIVPFIGSIITHRMLYNVKKKI